MKQQWERFELQYEYITKRAKEIAEGLGYTKPDNFVNWVLFGETIEVTVDIGSWGCYDEEKFEFGLYELDDSNEVILERFRKEEEIKKQKLEEEKKRVHEAGKKFRRLEYEKLKEEFGDE